jgi:hypothetical protein
MSKAHEYPFALNELTELENESYFLSKDYFELFLSVLDSFVKRYFYALENLFDKKYLELLEETRKCFVSGEEDANQLDKF